MKVPNRKFDPVFKPASSQPTFQLLIKKFLASINKNYFHMIYTDTQKKSTSCAFLNENYSYLFYRDDYNVKLVSY
jgi:hypothetical protein